MFNEVIEPKIGPIEGAKGGEQPPWRSFGVIPVADVVFSGSYLI